MKKELDISLIIPVYNSEKYISRCIKSILKQTFNNFELICIDDGSKDSSYKIIEELKRIDKRIKLIKQENSGPSKARNNGIKIANGKYIAFIDSDDYIEKDYLENMLNISNNSDIVITNYKEKIEDVEIDIDIFKLLKEEKVRNNSKIIYEVILGGGGYVWGKLFKKEILEKKNIIFDENIDMCEDLLFTLEVFINSKYISKSNKYGYIYNKSNCNSITKKYDYNMFFKQALIQEKLKNIINTYSFFLDDIDYILANRFKDILMYSIYKESIRKDITLRRRIENIDEMISCNETLKYKNLFGENGPIDCILVQSIIKKKAILTYIFTVIREKIICVYNLIN